MPCYTVNLTTVEFKVAHADLLQKAAKALGYSWSLYGNTATLSTIGSVIKVDLQAGVAVAQDASIVNGLKRAYSRECVGLACKLNLWQPVQKGVNKLDLVKGVL